MRSDLTFSRSFKVQRTRPACGLILTVVLGLATIPAGVGAETLDPALDVEALAVLEDGRLVIRNGDGVFDCDLVPSGDIVELSDCQPVGGGGVNDVALLADMSDADWRASIRDTLLDEECRLSTFEAVAEIVADAALARGVPAEAIDRAAAALRARANDIVADMLREGLLSYRGGELALDDCA